MRYYKLTISNVPQVVQSQLMFSGGTSGKWEISSLKRGGGADPSPLQIEFAIQAFSQASDSIPATIKITNVTRELFKKLNTLADQKCPLVLEAGYNPNLVLSSKLNYKNLDNQVILAGNIQNVVGDFSNRDNFIIITTALTQPRAVLDKIIQEQSGAQNKEGFSVEVKTGDEYKSILEKALGYLLTKGWKIVLSSVIKSAVYTAPQTTFLRFVNLFALEQALKLHLKDIPVGLQYDPTIQSVGCYELNNEADRQTCFEGKTVEILPSDLLAQPEYLGYSNMLSVTTRLRPDLHLGTKVKLKAKASLGGALSGTSFTSDGIADLSLDIEGEYTINNLIHQGNFYGSSPDSWSSQMQLVPVGGATLKTGESE